MDPRDILGDELDYGGVDARTATPGSSRAPDPAESQTGPATRAECERACRHIVLLGFRLERTNEPDPARRRELEAEHARDMQSLEVQRRIRELTDDCLAKRTSRREAKCILAVEHADQIDRCLD
jgi:hypothetical protein